LRATVDGRVARLTAAVGNLATSAQSIMVVVPLDVWVTANFKETQLANMRLGQPLDISIDAYGRSYRGGTSVAYVGQMVHSQAAILAYIDVFFALAVVAGIMSLSLRSVTCGARA